MAQQTEAECLLETGAMYGRRMLLRGASSEPVFAGFKPGAFSVYFGDAPIFHFDREGRWQRAFADQLHYLKGLDGSVQTIDRIRIGENLVLKRKTLNPSEAADFDERVRSAALDLIAALDSDRLEMVAPTTRAQPMNRQELRAFLQQIGAWDADAWEFHRESYRDIYGGPLPILPADCPSPIVLQATLGHENGVTFGGVPASTHSVRTPAVFAEHVRDVTRLLGRRVEQGKFIFLGGSDVLRRPATEISAYLECIRQTLPIDTTAGPGRLPATDDAPPRLNGVHAFLDRFEIPLHNATALASFRQGGLVRMSLGVESGDPRVRALYGKTWTDQGLRDTVANLKAAGIGVSLMTLVGAGGLANADRHLDGTADLINALELGPGDLVSLIDAEELAGAGSTAMSATARAGQLDALKARLAPVRTARKAKVAPYSLEKQAAF